MANFSIVAANVLPNANSTVLRGIAGVTMTAGQVVYRDANQLLQLASANASPVQTPAGITVNSAAAGQPINYVALDPGFTPGIAAIGVGTIAVLSETPGALCPPADLTTGDQPVFLLLGTGSATASLSIIPAGVKK